MVSRKAAHETEQHEVSKKILDKMAAAFAKFDGRVCGLGLETLIDDLIGVYQERLREAQLDLIRMQQFGAIPSPDGEGHSEEANSLIDRQETTKSALAFLVALHDVVKLYKAGVFLQGLKGIFKK